MRPTQVFLQFREEMVVTWGYIWAVGRVCDSIPSKFVDEIGCYTGDVRTSVVLIETHSLREHASPLVLNRVVKVLQRLTVAVHIDCCTGRHEFAQQ
jgi:hypothetical protein